MKRETSKMCTSWVFRISFWKDENIRLGSQIFFVISKMKFILCFSSNRSATAKIDVWHMALKYLYICFETTIVHNCLMYLIAIKKMFLRGPLNLANLKMLSIQNIKIPDKSRNTFVTVTVTLFEKVAQCHRR